MSDNLHRTRVIEDARAAHEWQVRRRRGRVSKRDRQALRGNVERLAQLVDDPDFEATAALGDDAAAADWRYGVRLLRAKTARERLDLTLADIKAWEYPEDPITEEGWLLHLRLLAEYLLKTTDAVIEAQQPVFEALWIAYGAEVGAEGTPEVT